MGVKHFYLWYRKNFDKCMSQQPTKPIDNLAIDMNGLFHLCAQKVFRYGNVNAPPARLLSREPRPPTITHLCKEICHKIEVCRQHVRPRKRLILCVDGIAGLGKMNQQRQRRFRASKSMPSTPSGFNPNAFTPGTSLMDYLTRYIDGFIKTMISMDSEWRDLEVVFSNEKVAGEGEHKIMQYIKQLNKPYETYCVYGLDADLIMLGMLLPVTHVCIYREMEYDVYHFLDIEKFQQALLPLLKWTPASSKVDEEDDIHNHSIVATFSAKNAIWDFVMLSFLVGNDFLPTIPSMAILDGTLDIILQIYHRVGAQYGHMTKRHPTTHRITFRMDALRHFLTELATFEKSLLQKKYNEEQSFFPDPLVLANLTIDDAKNMNLDFDNYKRMYYEEKVKIPYTPTDIRKLVHLYLDGMVWVINYYVHKIPDWRWFFPFLYAPFLSDMIQHMEDYTPPTFDQHEPVDPFLQLLIVMPPQCKDLLPITFHPVMTDRKSTLAHYFPDDFEIDVAGKRKEWEGIVLLPPISFTDFQKSYDQLKPLIPEKDARRNIRGKSFVYTYDGGVRHPQTVKTSYGVIPEYRVRTSIVRL